MNVSSTVKVGLLLALSIQGAAYLLLARYTRSVSPPDGMLYDIHDLVLMAEVIKLVVCCVAESISTGSLQASLVKSIWNRPFDALKSAVPAVVYVFQNSLTYLALSNLSAPLYVAMIQAKLFVTACVSVVLLQRVYSARQWTCLAVLTFGLIVILLEQEVNSRRRTVEEEVKDFDAEGREEELVLDPESIIDDVTLDVVDAAAEAVIPGGSFLVGCLSVMAACFCSAFAGVYMEKTIKKDDGISLYMRNIQLACFGIVVASAQSLAAYHRLNSKMLHEAFAHDEERDFKPVKFLHGFTTVVWVTCLLQAGGGLLIATIMKYLDCVMKGLATAISVILITIVSWLFMEDDAMTPTFVAGATVIMTSAYFFSNPLPSRVANSLGFPAKTEPTG